jgi:hypothetical protein
MGAVNDALQSEPAGFDAGFSVALASSEASIRQPFLKKWKKIAISQRARYPSMGFATSSSGSAGQLVSKRHSTSWVPAGGSISWATTPVARMIRFMSYK